MLLFYLIFCILLLASYRLLLAQIENLGFGATEISHFELEGVYTQRISKVDSD